ncbi:MAG: phosphate ABC transporter substrate-binding protein PstS [Tepidisphaeraceae bacterium]
MVRLIKSAAAAALAALVISFGPIANADVQLTGAGATFPQPLYERWVKEYQNLHPDVKIDYGGGGSGKGIKDITDKVVDFAGSDAPMSAGDIEKAGGADNLIEIPSCAGAVVPAFNLPGITDLNFDGPLLADIYLGKISSWNDPRIASLNPGVNLPSTPITCAWRTDGSGTTFVWTNYLATQSSDFKGSIGTGKQVQWPVGQGGKGNPGVAAVVQQTVGAIGYIEENYADQNSIAYGSVKNSAGKFIKASPDAVSAASDNAADSMSGQMLKATIWNQDGDSVYPISSLTYLIVYKDLNNIKSKDQAQALVDFLYWAEHDGQKFNSQLGYAPLGAKVTAKIEDAMSGITYNGDPIKPAGAK